MALNPNGHTPPVRQNLLSGAAGTRRMQPTHTTHGAHDLSHHHRPRLPPPPLDVTMALPLPMPAWIDPEAKQVLAQLEAPARRIKSEDDVNQWQTSPAHNSILLFVARLSDASAGHKTPPVAWDVPRTAALSTTDPITRTLHLLETLDAWTDEITPQTTSQRFGNRAFRTWGARLDKEVDALHTSLLPPALHPFGLELCAYLGEAFGSYVRLDYGTGHELNFVAWLSYLHRLHFFCAPGADAATVQKVEQRLALDVFPAYLRVVWHLQDRYALEPAGSHGAWGLDDFQFVPYILGSAQLQTADAYPPSCAAQLSNFPYIAQREPRIGPRLSVQKTLEYTPLPLPPASVPLPNLFLSSLARIHSLKRGPFTDHSPLLYDISSNVPTWYKVHAGLLKMYDAECLLKFPVIQHFPLGGVGFPWDGAKTERPVTGKPAAMPTTARPPGMPAAARPARTRVPPRS